MEETKTFFSSYEMFECGFPNPRLSNVFDGLSSLQFSDNIVWKPALLCC